MKKIPLILGFCLIASGCAFEDVKPTLHRSGKIIEKKITTESQFAQIDGRELAYSDCCDRNVVDGRDRVKWLSGLDMKETQLQRPVERLSQVSIDNVLGSTDDIVKSIVFKLSGGELSIEGLVELTNFKGDETARYFVEFLHSGPMTGAEMIESTHAWNKLVKELKTKGLNGNNVILGGSKYNQGVDAIVLVGVGK